MNPEDLARYLQKRVGAAVEIEEIRQLGGESTGAAALKGFGYGRPLLIRYYVGSREENIVLHRMQPNAFGRELPSDRAAAVWLDFNTFNELPRQAPALDMVVHTAGGELRSIGDAHDLLLITGYQPGIPYAEDLVRMRDTGTAQPLDQERAEALAGYLAEIHTVGHDDPVLWRRRLRDLVGHGEGIMGQTDSYPADAPYVNAAMLEEIEAQANRWRWKLKHRSERLSQVHGDFHPFNILFEDESAEFHVLDRSRGAWGEAADDVSALTINYLFFSLQRSGRLEGVFDELHRRFWEIYLSARPDPALAEVIQPWLTWRALVLASPVWYPGLTDENRRKLLGFARRVLSLDAYDPVEANAYLDPPG